ASPQILAAQRRRRRWWIQGLCAVPVLLLGLVVGWVLVNQAVSLNEAELQQRIQTLLTHPPRAELVRLFGSPASVTVQEGVEYLQWEYYQHTLLALKIHVLNLQRRMADNQMEQVTITTSELNGWPVWHYRWWKLCEFFQGQ
ncbi:MAG TPA: hypothetical protein PKA06_02915, partial [Gemmatales bacterium]|nr:hypothetical protein [Gemmatales bacterium]